MNDIFKNALAGFAPRYDSKPTQPKDMGEMSREDEDDLFNATLLRPEVADSAWEAIIDEVKPEKAREIIVYLFSRSTTPISDKVEAMRLMYMACYKRIEKIVEGEEHNTDMRKD